ncbi:MAG: hypothetical protein P1V36_14030 [Planctomycetota bacterium]|nr:hypothetical protein [Planctomycetota bacterium]
MATLEFSEVLAQRQAMHDDAGATTTTKDAMARSFSGKTIRAVGTVDDVSGQGEELTVRLAIEGEIMVCPLVRVHGRSMEATVTEATSWRRGEQVEVIGKLVWKSFSEELKIEILTAERVDPAA